MPERKYALRDQSTGFYDSETKFKILRDQQKELGNKIGKATRRAIQHGRLIEVREPITALMRRDEGSNSSKK